MITTEQLIAHKHWLEHHPNGQRLVLRGADLRDADLRDAYLSGAVLRGADLRGADLRDADLRGADLRDADLRDAYLSGAVLRGADLRGAVGLSIAADAPERLQAVARAALEPNALEMGEWHTCETTHCMAGWAVHLAGEPGRILESALGTEIAGLCLLGPEAHRYFFKGNDEAREFLDGVLTTTAEADRAQRGGGGMTELSPAAQAVMDAYGNQVGGSAAITSYERRGLAAALHAAAYQVVPARPSLDSCCEHWEQSIRHKLLAIAAELDGDHG